MVRCFTDTFTTPLIVNSTLFIRYVQPSDIAMSRILHFLSFCSEHRIVMTDILTTSRLMFPGFMLDFSKRRGLK